MATQRPSPVVGITRLGLTVAAAFGLGRVFGSGGWPIAAVAAAALPHAIVTYGDRRRWRAPLLLGALVLAAVAFTVYVVEPHTLRGVLPTGETVDAYAENLGNAANELRTAVVPVAPAGSALLLALLSLFVAGAVTEWSARRLEVTLGAISPSLVLFVAIAALGEGAWTAVTAVYALAVAAYLLALHASELLDRRSWFHAGRALHSRLLAGGSVAAVAIVFTAALVGPQVPGARSEAWFDYRSIGDGSGGGGLLKVTTPIVQIQAKLLDNPEEVVMIVTSPIETYHRAVALDRYDGNVWTLDDKGDPATDIPPARERPEAAVVDLRYQLLGADPHWLPAAYRPLSISLASAQVIRDSLTLYLNSDEPLSNLEYTVTSRIATPTPEQFAAAEPVDPDEFARYLELPDIPARVAQLAEDVTAGAEGPFEQALALRDYLGRNPDFTYDLNVARDQNIDNLEDFLFRVRRGYCEQYAASFGVMARSIGLPTRIAVGYTSGEPIGGDQWRVRNKNAHAWPEVYLEGIGWFPFDPTPGFNEPRLDGSGTSPANAGATTTTTTASGATGASGSTTPTAPRQALDDRGVQLGEDAPTSDDRSTAARVLSSLASFVASLAVVGVVVLAALFVVAWRRRWRRRHARDPRDRVLGAWSQALDDLAEAGVDPRPAATATEFALRYAPAQGAGDAGAPLVHLARLQTVAMFAAAPPTPADADEAWRYAAEIDHALWSKTPKLARLRRRLDPRGRAPTDD